MDADFKEKLTEITWGHHCRWHTSSELQEMRKGHLGFSKMFKKFPQIRSSPIKMHQRIQVVCVSQCTITMIAILFIQKNDDSSLQDSFYLASNARRAHVYNIGYESADRRAQSAMIMSYLPVQQSDALFVLHFNSARDYNSTRSNTQYKTTRYSAQHKAKRSIKCHVLYIQQCSVESVSLLQAPISPSNTQAHVVQSVIRNPSSCAPSWRDEYNMAHFADLAYGEHENRSSPKQKLATEISYCKILNIELFSWIFLVYKLGFTSDFIFYKVKLMKCLKYIAARFGSTYVLLASGGARDLTPVVGWFDVSSGTWARSCAFAGLPGTLSLHVADPSSIPSQLLASGRSCNITATAHAFWAAAHFKWRETHDSTALKPLAYP